MNTKLITKGTTENSIVIINVLQHHDFRSTKIGAGVQELETYQLLYPTKFCKYKEQKYLHGHISMIITKLSHITKLITFYN